MPNRANESLLRVVYSGFLLYRRPNAVYDLLPFLEPGLVLDVGAAAGGVSSLVARASPESTIIALEPFAGNWPHLDAAVAGLEQVTVDRRAASDVDGWSRLYVSTVVAGHEKGWESRVGYSSAGKLVDEQDARFEEAIDIETIRLDSLCSTNVRLLKIDVQGTELAVLTGAQALLEQELIDFMWVEFTGQLDILDFVRSHGFEVFDSQYLLIPREDPPAADEWMVEGTTNLSNGRTAYYAWPSEYPRSDVEYCAWFASQRAKFIIQTDLTFVRRDFSAEFFRAAAKALRA